MKLALHQRQVFAVNAAGGDPVVVEGGAGHVGHLAGNFVRGHGNDSDSAQGNHWQRNGIVAGENQEAFGHGVADFGDLADVAAGFFHSENVGHFGQARQGCGFDVGSGAAGNVVENDGFVDGVGDGVEVAILAFLRRLVVVRRGGQYGVDAGPGGNFFGFGNGVLGGVRSGSGDNGHAAGNDFDGEVDDVQPFVVRESWSFAGGAAGNQEINSGFDLPGHQVAQGRLVDGAVLTKWSYQRGAASTELHRIKIARMEEDGKWGALQFSPDVFEVEESLLAGEPFGGAHGAFGESAAGLGIVAEIDPVSRGIEDQFVHADDVAFPE